MISHSKVPAAFAAALVLAACAGNSSNVKPVATAATGEQDHPPLSQAGQSFTQKDMKNTGKVNVGSSLRTLDPVLTIRGNSAAGGF
jgi:uncharacterized lipoprotein YajG